MSQEQCFAIKIRKRCAYLERYSFGFCKIKKGFCSESQCNQRAKDFYWIIKHLKILRIVEGDCISFGSNNSNHCSTIYISVKLKFYQSSPINDSFQRRGDRIANSELVRVCVCACVWVKSSKEVKSLKQFDLS